MMHRCCTLLALVALVAAAGLGLAAADSDLTASLTKGSVELKSAPSLAFGPQTPFLDGDSYLFGYYYPGEMKNQSHVNDPVVADMLVRQRRTFDVGKRRELIHEAQRYLAKQVYYTTSVGTMYTVVWDGALKNYGPNLGYDYGGRLMAAWLDR